MNQREHPHVSHVTGVPRIKLKRRDAQSIQIVYLVSAVLWLAIVVFVVYARKGPYQEISAGKESIMGILVLLIPLFVYATSFFAAPRIQRRSERDLTRADSLTFTSVAVLLLINWVGKGKADVYRIVITSLILTVLSIIDVKTSPALDSIFFHTKEALQTAGLVLLVYALIVYIIDKEVTEVSEILHGSN